MCGVLNQMIRRTLTSNERGVALPLAMVTLVVLTGLMVAFAVLARSEPTIAMNQMQTAQALRLADSGLQLAMWALSHPAHAQGLDPAAMTHDGAVVAGRYDGTQVISAGTMGGFTVRITWEASPINGQFERTVTAVGWLPTKDGALMNSHRKIQAVIQQGYTPPLDNPTLQITAWRRNQAVEAGVQVSGTALAPRVQIVSQPAVSEGERLSWLVLGRAPTDATKADLGLLQAAAGALLARGDSMPLGWRGRPRDRQ